MVIRIVPFFKDTNGEQPAQMRQDCGVCQTKHRFFREFLCRFVDPAMCQDGRLPGFGSLLSPLRESFKALMLLNAERVVITTSGFPVQELGKKDSRDVGSGDFFLWWLVAVRIYQRNKLLVKDNALEPAIRHPLLYFIHDFSPLPA